jgi:hypothetical protein
MILGFGRMTQVGYFSVKSAYLVLRCSAAEEVTFSEEETMLLPKVWKTWPRQKWQSFLGNCFKIGCRLAIIFGNGESLEMIVLLLVFYVELGLNQLNTYSLLVVKSHLSGMIFFGG